MDLTNKIQEIANRFSHNQDNIKTEEATKNALIMPFITSLDYDVFNPSEVIPEFTADIGTKKNEKIDYAIKKEDEITILIECKWCGVNLDKNHTSQLYRYFAVTKARFAILTNGLSYEFYSDLEEPNKMDVRPFFVFNIMDFQEHEVEELKKFAKSTFSLENILTTASSLKYNNAVKNLLETELLNPSEEFVRFFASKVFEGRLTKPIITQFTNVVKNARQQFINEKINDRLKSALSGVNAPQTVEALTQEISQDNDNGVITTEEELEGYNIVKAILRQTIDSKRIVARDTKSYFGILLDDNNRKPICRLRFNHSQKYLGIITLKDETKYPIDSVDDIFNYTEQLIATVSEYS